ncbi:MAG: type II toxin-antitoxin system prevent-host-death family antitoxin [Deltaproteobacteria bacterium]|nr:type II toxin-antitoxin system prevent-host-death family antitoxin [Deltaproteobacteria bacterium]
MSSPCHEQDQPVFITRNEKGDMVVMSESHYERLQGLLDLYRKLGEAELQDAKGRKGNNPPQIV